MAPALFALAWGGNQFTPLLAMYRDLEGYGAATVNLLLAMYVVGLVPGFQLVGPLCNRFGRSTCVRAGLVVSALSSVLLALAPGQPAVLALGRLLAGFAVAVAMVVGTTWVDELTDDAAPTGTAARRAATTLTLGFGIGAGVAGCLSQWAPWPRVLPYLGHVLLVVAAAVVLRGARETAPPGPGPGRWVDLRLPRCHRHRFLWLVLPTAPWVFASAGLAYAIVPELVREETDGLRVAFATLLTVLTLGSGAVVQRWVPALGRVTGHREALVGISTMAVGVVLVAVEVHVRSVPLAVVAALVLGSAYGITIVAGLVEVRRIAAEEELPGLTGVFYALTYVGFALPAVLAALLPLVGYGTSTAVLAACCVACALATARGLAAGGAVSSRATRP
ncbi:MFS transporter [Nocardioides sp. J54]|uniref:MFS transporter n=1 Tax=Nocardioides sp. J54 TaxID=935866 RepID=UPI0004BC2198|nr:MFS transporter [Nocardioides sp. J54]